MTILPISAKSTHMYVVRFLYNCVNQKIFKSKKLLCSIPIMFPYLSPSNQLSTWAKTEHY